MATSRNGKSNSRKDSPLAEHVTRSDAAQRTHQRGREPSGGRRGSRARLSAGSSKKASRRREQSAKKRDVSPPRATSAASILKRPAKRKPHKSGESAASRPPKSYKRTLSKYLAHFKNTGMLFKKSLRNLILYPVAVICLYPMLVFRHNIYLMVLYLFIWTNVVMAVAIFLDELFDLPRKR